VHASTSVTDNQNGHLMNLSGCLQLGNNQSCWIAKAEQAAVTTGHDL